MLGIDLQILQKEAEERITKIFDEETKGEPRRGKIVFHLSIYSSERI